MRRCLTLLAILVLAVGVVAPTAVAKDGDDDTREEADDREDRRRSDDSSGSDDDGDDAGDRDDDDDADDVDDADDDDDRDDAADDRDDDDDRDDTVTPGDDDGTPDQGSGDAPGTPGGGPAPPVGGGAAPAPGTPAPRAVKVAMGEKTFSPATVSVALGGTVTWTNSSDREHTATADDNSFDSDAMATGRSYQFRFTKAGAVSYRCLIHSGMTGTVNVGAASAAGASAPGAAGAAAGSSGTPALGAASVAGAPDPPVGSVPAPALAQAAGGTATVKIADFDFAPATLTVAPGTEVKWTNAGQALHTVTGDGLDSGSLRSGQGYSHTFNEVGTFSYICQFHPDMAGTVKVSQGASTAAGGSGGADAASGDSAAGDAAASTIGAGDAEPASAGLAGTGGRAALALAMALLAITAGVVLLRRRSSAT